MMLSHCLVVATLSVVAYAITVNDCPTSLTRDKYLQVYKDKCYRFDTTNAVTTFHDAQINCKRDGGNLAMVKSHPVNRFIKEGLNGLGFNTSHIWIGLRYNLLHLKFYWVDGTHAGYENFKDSKFFHSENECVAMNTRSGMWEVYKCHGDFFDGSEKSHYVCEYPPTNQTVGQDHCPSNLKRDKYLKVHGNKCYQFATRKTVPFKAAKKYCEDNGGHLAFVKSKYINDYLRQELSTLYGGLKTHFWIGLIHDHYLNGYHWTDGTSLDYNNLRYNIHLTDSECAAISTKDGVWDVYRCRKDLFGDVPDHHFICEYDAVDPVTVQPSTTSGYY